MITRLGISVRRARPSDRQQLTNLIHFEGNVHRHLEWRTPLDWLDSEPYLVVEESDEITAVLACPPDPERVAWIRLFGAASRLTLDQAWKVLWPAARRQLVEIGNIIQVAALPLQPWFEELLRHEQFQEVTQVVMLTWERQAIIPYPARLSFLIRPMRGDDLPAVFEVDAAAFVRLWQNSLRSLELAYQQSAIATVVELDGDIIGYQISTATPFGGHLARLAVLPIYQGFGIGHALVQDLLRGFVQQGADQVTVNTQNNNVASLNVYAKEGFRRTGEKYPVYELLL